jgi:outer membrane protein TolC
MRRKSWGGGLVLLAAAVGCTRTCYMTCEDNVMTSNMMSQNLQLAPELAATPTIDPTAAPATTAYPERPIRFFSLAEAIAIALEQGTVGNQNSFLSAINAASPSGSLVASDQPVSFNGRSVGASDAIRVLALDPATIGAGIDLSLSKFDTLWSTSMNWQTTDRPVGTPLDVFQTGQNGATNAITQTDATFNTSLVKNLPTGGTAGITFSVPYTLTNLPARVNPAYRPALQFQFEQPLLQGFGVEINQLRAQHPGASLLPGLQNINTGPTPEGILITRIRFDQQRAEFERNVHTMLLNVEIAYWNLYNSYWQLYAQEQGMRQAFEAWKINLARYQAGRVGVADLAQTRGQYELFRGQRLTALRDLLENERQMRAMLQLPVEDGYRLVPSDTPTLAPIAPDWGSAFQEAMSLRPELYMLRQDIRANQLNVILQENNLLPDLRFAANYDLNSIGNRLDGADGENALRNLASDRFNNWQLLLRLNVPIGFRAAHANVRIAKLQLARSYESLHDQEFKVQRVLGQQYRQLQVNYELIRIRRAQREAFADQLRARFQEFLAGRGTLDILLEAQRFWASALADEYTAIRDYNNNLVGWEWSKGTILQHDNVIIGEAGLPCCAQKRAVEHLRERSAALTLRERAVPVSGNGGCETDGCAAPVTPGSAAPSLTEMPKLPPPPETLPAPAAGGAPGPAAMPAAGLMKPSDFGAARPPDRSPMPQAPAGGVNLPEMPRSDLPPPVALPSAKSG